MLDLFGSLAFSFFGAFSFFASFLPPWGALEAPSGFISDSAKATSPMTATNCGWWTHKSNQRKTLGNWARNFGSMASFAG